MLAFALLPTVSHALAHAQQQGVLGDICRAPASPLAEASSAPGVPMPGAMLGHLQHCPMCAGADQLPLLVSALLELGASQPPADRLPLLAAPLPRDQAAAWLALRKHGPPSFA